MSLSLTAERTVFNEQNSFLINDSLVHPVPSLQEVVEETMDSGELGLCLLDKVRMS
jgi:hypothetical protein